MQRQEQPQRQMQQQMQAAQEAQTQLLTLLAQQMQQSQGAAQLVAAPPAPPGGGLAARGPIQSSIQNHWAETPIVHTPPQGCQECANHISVIMGHREMRCPRVAEQYTLTLRLTLLLPLSLLLISGLERMFG